MNSSNMLELKNFCKYIRDISIVKKSSNSCRPTVHVCDNKLYNLYNNNVIKASFFSTCLFNNRYLSLLIKKTSYDS